MNNLFLQFIQPILPGKTLQANKELLAVTDAVARSHNLLMLVYVQLLKYQKEVPGNTDINTFLADLKVPYLNNASRTIKQEVVEKEVISLLKEDKIPSIVIKGSEIAKEIYLDAYCRSSVDIDFLIKKSDALLADIILSSAGYIRTDNKPLKFWLSRIHHATYIAPKTKETVEVHWDFGIPSFFNLTSEDIWNEVVIGDEGEHKLSPDMVLIELLIHHSLHAYRDLKVLVDILWTIYRYEDVIDWPLFTKKIKKTGLGKTTNIALFQIQHLWKDSVKQYKAVEILNNGLEKAGIKTPAFLLSFFNKNIEQGRCYHHIIEQLMVRLTLENWKVILFSFIKTVFPFPGSIKEFYNDNRNYYLPVNYLRFIVWRLRGGTAQ